LDLDEDKIRAKIQDCGRSLNGTWLANGCVPFCKRGL
jgi:hypothetical protein